MSMNVSSTQAKLDHIRQLLETGDSEKALQFIEKGGSQGPDLKNALGVCHMRLGQTEKAVNILRELVYGKQMCIPSDTPPLFQANYATALLLKNYNQSAIDIIKDLPASSHPYVGRLRQTVKHWQKKLPLHQRLACLIKLYPRRPVSLAFPPGEV